MATMIISDSAIRSPGISPAANSSPIEADAMTPKITSGSEGGMIGPMVDDAAVMPTEKSVS